MGSLWPDPFFKWSQVNISILGSPTHPWHSHIFKMPPIRNTVTPLEDQLSVSWVTFDINFLKDEFTRPLCPPLITGKSYQDPLVPLTVSHHSTERYKIHSKALPRNPSHQILSPEPLSFIHVEYENWEIGFCDLSLKICSLVFYLTSG